MATLQGRYIQITGLYFQPTDIDLVICYLVKKILEQDFPRDVIVDHDIYSTEPWNLPENCSSPHDRKSYYFTHAKKSSLKGTRLVRQAGKGYWHMNGINKKIYHNGLSVAYTTALTYMHGMHGEKKKTKWVMHEYRIDPSYLRLPPQEKELVLCHIQQSGRTTEPDYSKCESDQQNAVIRKRLTDQEAAKARENGNKYKAQQLALTDILNIHQESRSSFKTSNNCEQIRPLPLTKKYEIDEKSRKRVDAIGYYGDTQQHALTKKRPREDDVNEFNCEEDRRQVKHVRPLSDAENIDFKDYECSNVGPIININTLNVFLSK